jgi:hypothetical protein
MAANDPFTQAQTDILGLLDQTRPQLSSYLRIRSSASSATTPELIEARQELEGTLTDLSTDLQDLVDSVKAVESDPYRYGLDVAEVAKRRKLVADVGREVEDMHRQLNETVQYADGKAGLAHPDSFGDVDGDEGDDYGAWEEQRQMEIMHEQDEALDDVFVTVGNLRAQADTMGRELEEQAELLDDTENITDRVQGKLSDGMKKIRYVIEQNEGESMTRSRIPPDLKHYTDGLYRSLFKLLYHRTGHCLVAPSCARHHAMISSSFMPQALTPRDTACIQLPS